MRSMIVTSTPVAPRLPTPPTNERGGTSRARPTRQAGPAGRGEHPAMRTWLDRVPAPHRGRGCAPWRGRLVVDPTRPRGHRGQPRLCGHRGQPRLCGHCRCSVRRATAPRDKVDACPRSRGSDHQIKSGRHTLTMSRPVGRRHRSQPAVASSTPETTPTQRDLSIDHTVTGASRPRRSTPSTSTSKADLEKQLHSTK